MLRFYHKQRLFLAGLILLIVFLFLRPILPYASTGAKLWGAFLAASTSELRAEAGRTNILVLGLGGPKNEPSGLTDTIIFTSLDQAGRDTLLLSLSRDIWIPQIRAKLNTAYYYGNREEGLGLEWARRYTEEIVGQPVHYVLVVSFDGFVKLIDALGGVEVVVERGFIDAQYPIPGRESDNCGGDETFACRFETVSFNSGRQHFDGATALKFARSRNAQGAEGSDFARASRQQKIIFAVKEKLLSPAFFLAPHKIARVMESLTQSTDTDISESHLAALARLALKIKATPFRSEVINGGFLENPPISKKYDNQWVLVPKEGNWQDVQDWVKQLLFD